MLAKIDENEIIYPFPVNGDHLLFTIYPDVGAYMTPKSMGILLLSCV